MLDGQGSVVCLWWEEGESGGIFLQDEGVREQMKAARL